jgi:hypothetical protein
MIRCTPRWIYIHLDVHNSLSRIITGVKSGDLGVHSTGLLKCETIDFFVIIIQKHNLVNFYSILIFFFLTVLSICSRKWLSKKLKILKYINFFF